MLFWQCLILGVTSFGGGLIVYVRSVFVKRRGWVDETQFLEAMEVAQAMPGPNVINLVLMLCRLLRGTTGAMLGFIGLVTPAIIANALLVSFLLSRDSGSVLNGVLAGFGSAAAGLAIANASQMGIAHLRGVADIALTVIAALTVIVLKPSLLVAIAVFGTAGVVLHLVRARRSSQPKATADA